MRGPGLDFVLQLLCAVMNDFELSSSGGEVEWSEMTRVEARRADFWGFPFFAR